MEYKGRKIRHELKYSINNFEYTTLKTRLRNLMYKDKNANKLGEYHIRSLYFDDISNSSYNEKEGGVFHRKKYRIRIYNKSDNFIQLEKKEKFDSYISKISRTISKELYYDILNNTMDIRDFKDDEFLLEFYLRNRMDSLSPAVIVDYIREPYIFPSGNVRITFDKNLQAVINTFDIFDEYAQVLSPFLDGDMILEVKYDDYLPEFIRKGLGMSGYQLMALSKYTICRELRNNVNWSERLL